MSKFTALLMSVTAATLLSLPAVAHAHHDDDVDVDVDVDIDSKIGCFAAVDGHGGLGAALMVLGVVGLQLGRRRRRA